LQFRLQQLDYSARFAADGHELILRDGEPAGRVWVAELTDHLLLVDIALMPEQRGRGIGTAIIRDIAAAAAARGQPLRATVRQANTRARAFYERLGFEPIAEDQVYAVLER
jgi:ribosomal protein S18 acetylase RimI-like enzyme